MIIVESDVIREAILYLFFVQPMMCIPEKVLDSIQESCSQSLYVLHGFI